jgi:hypothetical protein
VTQRIDGVSTVDFHLDYNLNIFVFQETVVKITHLEDVNEVKVLDVHAYMVATDATAHSKVLMLTTNVTEGVEIVYQTSVVIGEGNAYSDADEAYDSTVELLESSISSGEFTSSLDTYASKENSVLMYASASVPAEVGPPTSSTIDEVNDTSGGKIFTSINILIVVVCLLVLTFSLGVYCWKRHLYISGKGTWRTKASFDEKATYPTLRENLI